MSEYLFPNPNEFNPKSISNMSLYDALFDLYAEKSAIDLIHTALNNELADLSANTTSQQNVVHQEAAIRLIGYRSYNISVVALYSIVEYSIDSYCNKFQQTHRIKILLSDISGKGLQRTAVYMEKIMKLGTIRDDMKWSKIKVINTLRNDIVHRGGYQIPKENLRLYKEQLNIENPLYPDQICITYENVCDIYDICKSYLRFVFSLEDKAP